jgi:hypothetical protein
MLKDLVIGTQYMENYGAHSWDGQGDCPQYWKAKGGEETIVTNVPEGTDIDAILDQLRSELEWSSDFSQQYIVGYGLEESNYKTDFERDQEEYDGEVAYPAHRIDYSDLKLEMDNV